MRPPNERDDVIAEARDRGTSARAAAPRCARASLEALEASTAARRAARPGACAREGRAPTTVSSLPLETGSPLRKEGSALPARERANSSRRLSACRGRRSTARTERRSRSRSGRRLRSAPTAQRGRCGRSPALLQMGARPQRKRSTDGQPIAVMGPRSELPPQSGGGGPAHGPRHRRRGDAVPGP